MNKELLHFILFKHFSNGFVVWSYFITLTYFVQGNEIIESFRTSLWVDQIHWAFLVPIILQSGYGLTSKIKPLDIQRKRYPKEFILLGLVIGVGVVF